MEHTRRIFEQEAAERDAETREREREAFKEFVELDAKTRTYAKAEVRIDDFPDECPKCHKSGEQVFFDWAYLSDSNPPALRLVMRCPRRDCDAAYFAVYEPHTRHDDVFFYRRSEPVVSEGYGASNHIVALSPNFVAIATEAKAAEEMALLQICGPGYRKALEFLIKDYLMSLPALAAEHDNIKKKLLGPCISDYIDNGKIKEMAKRAAWLGNDETHYERKWIDKDLEHLKALIRLTVRFIESDIEAQQFMVDMQKGK